MYIKVGVAVILTRWRIDLAAIFDTTMPGSLTFRPIFLALPWVNRSYGAGHQILVRIRDIFKMLRLLRMASPRETKTTPRTSTTRTIGPRSDFLPGSCRGPNGVN